MSTVPVSQLGEMDKVFLGCSYAMMILHDENLKDN